MRIDVAKTHALSSSLQALSHETRAKEIGAPTKIKVNVKGNQRGVHALGESEKMKRLRAMRRLWNAKMPVMHCNSCAFSQQCPQFKAGYECAFNRFFDAHTIQNEDDLIFYAKEMCTQGVKRAQKMLLFETMSGGAPSLETSEALSIAFAQLMQLHDRVTSTTEIEMESSEGTIIGKLFGGLEGLLSATNIAVDDPIEVPSSSAESTLIEDKGVSDMPLDPSHTPRKLFDPGLARSFAAAGLGLPENSVPQAEEMPLP